MVYGNDRSPFDSIHGQSSGGPPSYNGKFIIIHASV